MRQILDQKIVQLEKSFDMTIKKNSEQQKEKIEQLRKTIETKFSNNTNHKKNSFVRMGTMLPDEDAITNESISPLRRMSSFAFQGGDKRRSNFAQSRGRSTVSVEPTQVSPYSIKAEIERMNSKSEKNFKAIVQDEVASM